MLRNTLPAAVCVNHSMQCVTIVSASDSSKQQPTAVSYTHLDVYKRQEQVHCLGQLEDCNPDNPAVSETSATNNFRSRAYSSINQNCNIDTGRESLVQVFFLHTI